MVGNDRQFGKHCSSCKEWLPATREFFCANRLGRNGLQSQCKECLRQKAQQKDRRAYRKQHHEMHKEHDAELGRRYYQAHRKQRLARIVITQRARAQKLKIEALVHYGNNRCDCVKCGFNNVDALTIDHMNGNGNKHRQQLGRSGVSFYYWLAKNNYPEGYQTLCMNCQFIKLTDLFAR